jgi:N4-gp56 family major capsid protein
VHSRAFPKRRRQIVAVTTYGVNHASAVKLWSKRLSVEVLQDTYAMRFTGKSQGALIEIKDETAKGPGDKVTFALRMQMTQDGVVGDDTAEGSEEAIVTYSDSIVIDQLRLLTRSKGKMSEQRVPFSVREEGLSGLKDLWTDRLDEAFFNQVCGNTVQSLIARTGLQAVTAPDSDHIIRFGANAAADESITTTATFALGILDTAVERARTLSPGIRPIKINGQDHFVAFLHPYQVTAMRSSTTTGQWLDISKAMYQGSGSDNPIYNGALGMYNNVVLHQDKRVTLGVAAAGTAVAAVRRGVFCGAQAAVMAFGREGGPERFNWVEKTFDYDNQLGISAGLIHGLKKTIYNAKDFGTIVLATYATAS